MSFMTRKISIIALCGMVAFFAARSTRAHHSNTMFDFAKQVQVSGTVRTLEWANPHVWLWLIKTDENGTQSLYAFEGTSINEMSRRSGWKKSIVASGDKVTMKFSPFKDGRNGGRMLAVTLADGRVLSADSGVHLPPAVEPGPPQ